MLPQKHLNVLEFLIKHYLSKKEEEEHFLVTQVNYIKSVAAIVFQSAKNWVVTSKPSVNDAAKDEADVRSKRSRKEHCEHFLKALPTLDENTIVTFLQYVIFAALAKQDEQTEKNQSMPGITDVVTSPRSRFTEFMLGGVVLYVLWILKSKENFPNKEKFAAAIESRKARLSKDIQEAAKKEQNQQDAKLLGNKVAEWKEELAGLGAVSQLTNEDIRSLFPEPPFSKYEKIPFIFMEQFLSTLIEMIHKDVINASGIEGILPVHIRRELPITLEERILHLQAIAKWKKQLGLAQNLKEVEAKLKVAMEAEAKAAMAVARAQHDFQKAAHLGSQSSTIFLTRQMPPSLSRSSSTPALDSLRNSNAKKGGESTASIHPASSVSTVLFPEAQSAQGISPADSSSRRLAPAVAPS